MTGSFSAEELAVEAQCELQHHAIQSGVMMIQQFEGDGDASATGSKKLRVGVNLGLCDHAALVELLIENGVINRLEYFKKRLKYLNNERQNYEKRLSKITGMGVELG